MPSRHRMLQIGVGAALLSAAGGAFGHSLMTRRTLANGLTALESDLSSRLPALVIPPNEPARPLPSRRLKGPELKKLGEKLVHDFNTKGYSIVPLTPELAACSSTVCSSCHKLHNILKAGIGKGLTAITNKSGNAAILKNQVDCDLLSESSTTTLSHVDEHLQQAYTGLHNHLLDLSYTLVWALQAAGYAKTPQINKAFRHCDEASSFTNWIVWDWNMSEGSHQREHYDANYFQILLAAEAAGSPWKGGMHVQHPRSATSPWVHAEAELKDAPPSALVLPGTLLRGLGDGLKPVLHRNEWDPSRRERVSAKLVFLG